MKKNKGISLFLLWIMLSSTCLAQGPSTETNHSKISGYAPVNGLKIYYEIHGQGKPIILLHGSYLNIDMNWGNIIPELSRTRKVIAIEMQGHGRTNDNSRAFSYDSLASDVNSVLSFLKIDSADVMGYSLGGSVAYKLAINYPPKVDNLIILSATYKSTGWQSEVVNVLNTMKPEFLTNNPLKSEYMKLAPDTTRWNDFVSRLISFNKTEYDFGENEISALKMPVFIIAGDNDGLDKIELMKTYKLIGGCTFADISGLPKSQLAILPNTTHTSIVLASEKIVALVNSFLE